MDPANKEFLSLVTHKIDVAATESITTSKSTSSKYSLISITILSMRSYLSSVFSIRESMSIINNSTFSHPKVVAASFLYDKL